MVPDEPVPPIPMPEGEPPNEDVQNDEDGDDTLYNETESAE